MNGFIGYTTKNAKTYPCLACNCGRSLQVESADQGGFFLTLSDPEIEFTEWIDAAVLRDRLVDAEEDEFLVFASNGVDEGGIFLSDEQIADLRAWMEIVDGSVTA